MCVCVFNNYWYFTFKVYDMHNHCLYDHCGLSPSPVEEAEASMIKISFGRYYNLKHVKAAMNVFICMRGILIA